ncbi:lasso peptide biosynthesis B2 protein [Micromonospora carbonacea]|uniref:Transglutaminase-like superfamily protein n=1 Tax=Micromonospora carbonacea TaxID=47853 RepID=A0A1C5AZ57_9ACTN|nr:lasso peptide biosynthesis B2 protein [Micromonospora carbonacea]SCF50443.1 Transglutaminase-like superfamily protein [Micromonospora carbonacea]
MSGVTLRLESASAPPWHLRPPALLAAGVARLLTRLPPATLRRALVFASRGAHPANVAQVLRARNAVVYVSLACAGPRCLQRSIAAAMLCRLGGTWPQWCTGVVTEPFAAHAWLAVDGEPVGEDPGHVRAFHVIMSVPPRR